MSKRGWLLFAAMSVIWGIPYLLIKVALEGMPAPFIVFARTAIGAAVLLPVAWRRGMVGPALKQWRYIAAFAALEIAGPWLLLGRRRAAHDLVAGRTADRGRAVLRRADHVAAGRPLGGVRRRGWPGCSSAWPAWSAIVGLNIGQVQVLRMLEVIAVAVGYAIAPIIADRKLVGVPTLATITLSLTGVALLYLPIAAFSHPRHMPKANALAAVVGLGLVCTAAAFLLFFALIGEVGPAKSSMITFVNPAVAVSGGVLFLGETIKAGVIVGAPLVMIGLVLSTLRRGDEAAPASSSEAASTPVAPAGAVAATIASEDCGPEAAIA